MGQNIDWFLFSVFAEYVPYTIQNTTCELLREGLVAVISKERSVSILRVQQSKELGLQSTFKICKGMSKVLSFLYRASFQHME